MIKIIAAIDKNNAIGSNGEIPWRVSEDFTHFKNSTMGSTVLMGHKTWKSLPKKDGKALPGRRCIILSRSLGIPKHPSFDDVKNAYICANLDDALALQYYHIEEADAESDDNLWIIGGGEIYQQTMDMADELHVTNVMVDSLEPDAFFPVIDKSIWEPTVVSDIQTQEDGVQYYFSKYEKIT